MGAPCHQAHFQRRPAAHYNIGFPLSCHYHTLSLKADPKDRQSIKRQSSHLYLLNVLMSSISGLGALLLDIGAEVAIGGVRCRIAGSGGAHGEGKEEMQ